MSDRHVLVRIAEKDDPVVVLRDAGVAVPGWCNGAGVCGLCRVRIATGMKHSVSEADRSFLTSAQLKSGWRLACQMAPGEYVLEPMFSTTERVVVRTPEDIVDRSLWPGRVGPGIALDLGTTTVMCTVFDGHGSPGTVFCIPNRQAVFGANVIDRLTAARQPAQRKKLQELATDSLSTVVTAALERHQMNHWAWIGIVGNTAMHHLLAGLSTATLSAHPYVPEDDGFEWREIRLQTNSSHGEIEAALVPPLGGFVGSDALAASALVRERLKRQCWVLIDIGTNCEVVLGIEDHLFYSSAPAGPAFEGGHLSCGMLAANGAVERISEREGEIRWSMIGEGRPVGLCGAAAVDFLAKSGFESLRCMARRYLNPTAESNSANVASQDSVVRRS